MRTRTASAHLASLGQVLRDFVASTSEVEGLAADFLAQRGAWGAARLWRRG